MPYTTNGLVPTTIIDFWGNRLGLLPWVTSMERAEYDLMAAVEDRMWWYRGLHALARGTWLRTQRGRSIASSLVSLDAGCGTGGLLRKLAAVAPPPLVGLEFVEPAAIIAHEKSGCPIAVGSVNDLPFDDSSLAAVFSMDVLCHRGVDESRSLAEMYRCLAKGGVILVNLPAYRWMLSVHDERVHNIRRYCRAEVITMLTNAGFRDVAVSYWNTFLFPLMVLKRKVLRGAESDVREFSAPLEFLFRSVLCFERMLLRLGLRLPFGGSIFAVAVKP